jgi:hypothetical protein
MSLLLTPTNSRQDLSNYWFPKLYFQDPKTKLFEPVANGGLLVYYQNRGDGDKSNGGPGIKVGFSSISNLSIPRSIYKLAGGITY